jgi:uncharacterized LabA/DUF88 family protein
MLKVSVLIDGGHLRVLARKAGLTYSADFIETISKICVSKDETLLRVLYYDCAPFKGNIRLPVSGDITEFSGNDAWLRDLAGRELFAVRRGILKFRGFKPRQIPISGRALTDDDFTPVFEQKGVDMRIGLDIANFAVQKSVDRIILITADTDCIPAMKHARIYGLQVVMVRFPTQRLADELLWHTDLQRHIDWPAASE